MSILASPAGSAAPFLKWAGGKTQLLAQLADFFPERANRYFEPFLGSGAVFFGLGRSLGEASPVLSDSNEHLINAFRVVRDAPEDLLVLLLAHAERHSKEHYYSERSVGLKNGSSIERAARLIYLNRTCFNGLFRLNRKGQFNVPMGKYANPKIHNVFGIHSASKMLAGSEIRVADYRDVLREARSGDFVYLDPPYDPVSTTSSFTAYTSNAFGKQNQEELARCVDHLTAEGVRVAMSNSSTPFILSLYGGKYRIFTVPATRRINSRAERRGVVDELVIMNY